MTKPWKFPDTVSLAVYFSIIYIRSHKPPGLPSRASTSRFGNDKVLEKHVLHLFWKI